MGDENDARVKLRVLQPSASSAGLLLACQWPWFRPLSSVPMEKGSVWQPKRANSPEAAYGLAIHELLASKIIGRKISTRRIAAKYSIEDVPALKAHAREATEALVRWMKSGNPWGFDLTKGLARTEFAVAYNVLKSSARITRPPTEDTHEYRNIKQSELPGTADLVLDSFPPEYIAGGCPEIIVIDHKTGDGWDLPRDNKQLLTLAVAHVARVGARTAAVGIFHTPMELASTMYVDELSSEQLAAHRNALRVAWRNIGTGMLRPGGHCGDCQAIALCPAQAGAITQVETSLAMTPARVGEIHQKLAAFRKAEEALTREVQAYIRVHGAVPRPDGKWAVLREVQRENISLKSIRDALGLVEGEKLINELRARGAVKPVSYDEVRAVNDQ